MAFSFCRVCVIASLPATRDRDPCPNTRLGSGASLRGATERTTIPLGVLRGRSDKLKPGSLVSHFFFERPKLLATGAVIGATSTASPCAGWRIVVAGPHLADIVAKVDNRRAVVFLPRVHFDFEHLFRDPGLGVWSEVSRLTRLFSLRRISDEATRTQRGCAPLHQRLPSPWHRRLRSVLLIESASVADRRKTPEL